MGPLLMLRAPVITWVGWDMSPVPGDQVSGRSRYYELTTHQCSVHRAICNKHTMRRDIQYSVNRQVSRTEPVKNIPCVYDFTFVSDGIRMRWKRCRAWYSLLMCC